MYVGGTSVHEWGQGASVHICVQIGGGNYVHISVHGGKYVYMGGVGAKSSRVVFMCVGVHM